MVYNNNNLMEFTIYVYITAQPPSSTAHQRQRRQEMAGNYVNRTSIYILLYMVSEYNQIVTIKCKT